MFFEFFCKKTMQKPCLYIYYMVFSESKNQHVKTAGSRRLLYCFCRNMFPLFHRQIGHAVKTQGKC